MIKAFILLQRKDDITDAHFSEHWYEVHGPLALRLRTLRAYVQSHRIEQEIPEFASGVCSGIAEVWMDSLADAQGIPEDPDYIEGLYQDEPNFLIREKTRYLFTREYNIIEPPHLEVGKDNYVKSVYLTKKRADLGLQEFQHHWLEKHAPMVHGTPGLLGYTQAHVMDETYGETIPDYDGVAELWWPDVETFLAAWNSADHQQEQLEDLQNFIDMENTQGMLVLPRRLL